MLTVALASLALTFAADDDQNGAEAAAPSPVLHLETPETPDPAESADPGLVVSEAGRYAAYHAVIADLADAPIAGPDDLDSAMDRLTAFYGEERLARAWIAYAAIIAAQHPEYIDEVRELADYYGAEAATQGLMYDPTFATSFRSAGEAEDSVVEAVERDNDRIRLVSDRYRAAAYDLQHSDWANLRARDRQDRLAAMRLGQENELDVSDEELMALIETQADRPVPASSLFTPISAPSPSTASATAAAPSLTLEVGEGAIEPDRQRMGRILSVAALQAISDDPANVEAAIVMLMNDPAVERCMAWVRLDMEQCVAAGHFKFEDSFCIAEHALGDVSDCLGVGQ